MKKHNKIVWSLSGIIVVLITALFFILGSSTQQKTIKSNKNIRETKTTQVSQKVASATKNSNESVISSSSFQPKKEKLSYQQLAVAAYINTLRGDSIEEKMNIFNECVNGESSNPATEQPTSFEQHNDPTFQINEGDMGFAWYVISFNEDSIDVEHFTHGEQDSSKSFNKSDIEEKYSSYKSQLDEAIQKINQNQQNVSNSQDDDSNEE